MQTAIDPHRMKRILIVRADRMGDVVITTPVFSEIKRHYPNAFVSVLVSKEYRDLVDGNPWVDEVIGYDKRGTEGTWLGALRFTRFLHQKRFDLAVHLHPRDRMHWTSFLARIPIRIGYRYKNHWLLTHTLPYDKPEGKKHEAEYNFDLLGLLGISAPPEPLLHVPLRPVYEHGMVRKLEGTGRFAAFHPSASCPSKIWPAGYFAEVADYLSEKYQFTPVIIGGPSEKRFGEEMRQQMKRRALDLSGQLEVGELAWLFKKAELLVSNDSGPVHVAAAVGTPVLSIFGRNQAGLCPVRWRPLGENSRYIQKDVGCIECLAHRCQIEFRCLQELKPAEVIPLVDQLIQITTHGTKR